MEALWQKIHRSIKAPSYTCHLIHSIIAVLFGVLVFPHVTILIQNVLKSTPFRIKYSKSAQLQMLVAVNSNFALLCSKSHNSLSFRACIILVLIHSRSPVITSSYSAYLLLSGDIQHAAGSQIKLTTKSTEHELIRREKMSVRKEESTAR